MWKTDRLEKIRLERGYTQADLAKLLDISEVTYQRYESGKTEPKIGLAALMAQKLDTTVAYLVGDTEESKRVVLVAELSGSRKTNIDAIREGVDPELVKKAVAFLAGLTDN